MALCSQPSALRLPGQRLQVRHELDTDQQCDDISVKMSTHLCYAVMKDNNKGELRAMQSYRQCSCTFT